MIQELDAMGNNASQGETIDLGGHSRATQYLCQIYQNSCQVLGPSHVFLAFRKPTPLCWDLLKKV